ncbi:MAG: helix-turn-helix transcriptional regulator [Firmicutes bacterium]|nr:helix-turn-helix transcriptional regulator [Bacillota bacterium]
MRYKLYQLRIQKGYSHNDIAKAVGITRRMYSFIESGHRNPSWSVAQRLEQFFGIPAGELLAESDAEK